jgi:hypothetical protein
MCMCVCVYVIATIQISMNGSPHVSVTFAAINTSFSLPMFNEEAGNDFQYELYSRSY